MYGNTFIIKIQNYSVNMEFLKRKETQYIDLIVFLLVPLLLRIWLTHTVLFTDIRSYFTKILPFLNTIFKRRAHLSSKNLSSFTNHGIQSKINEWKLINCMISMVHKSFRISYTTQYLFSYFLIFLIQSVIGEEFIYLLSYQWIARL